MMIEIDVRDRFEHPHGCITCQILNEKHTKLVIISKSYSLYEHWIQSETKIEFGTLACMRLNKRWIHSKPWKYRNVFLVTCCLLFFWRLFWPGNCYCSQLRILKKASHFTGVDFNVGIECLLVPVCICVCIVVEKQLHQWQFPINVFRSSSPVLVSFGRCIKWPVKYSLSDTLLAAMMINCACSNGHFRL